jgi:hypothetical protein
MVRIQDAVASAHAEAGSFARWAAMQGGCATLWEGGAILRADRPSYGTHGFRGPREAAEKLADTREAA